MNIVRPSRVLVTGGAGFIGSALIRYLLSLKNISVLNIDKLTYAGNLDTLSSVDSSENYRFIKADICDTSLMRRVFKDFLPDAIVHLAAESHVDRSIDSAGEFIQTNVVGTFSLLEAARDYYASLEGDKKRDFRFHHVSTDEVYGDLEGTKDLFTELTPYAPSSPYSASKAASDHLVRAWSRTYSLPVLLTNCSNNYGPYQYPEKLIPLMISNILERKPLPVYGKGNQIRDWLYVDDHVEAIYAVLTKGRVGETYNIGGHNEKKNIEVVETLCFLLDDLVPSIQNSSSLITHVEDRPGHDLRYAIDARKIEKEVGWVPKETFDSGLRKTVEWYLTNAQWVGSVKSGCYDGSRLGALEGLSS